jgi:hypothetical protein
MSFTDNRNSPARATEEPVRPVAPRGRWSGRWGVWFLLALIGCIALVVGKYSYNRHQSVQKLQAAVAELDRTDPGWRLADVEAARAVVPEGANSAPVVKEAFRLMPKDWPGADNLERISHLPQGPPQVLLNDEDAAWLRKELQQQQTALGEAHKMAELPHGRYPITYNRNFVGTLLPDVQNVRQVVFLLQLDAALQAQDGDLKGALRSCRAQLNAARSIGDEPLLISQLVRIAGVFITCPSVERVLAQGEPDPDDLLDMQKLLQEEERFPRLLVGMRGERAGTHQLLDGLETGDVPLSDLAEKPRSWADRLMNYPTRDSVRAEHPKFLELETEMVRIAALPDHERAQPWEALDAELRSQPPGLLQLLIPAVIKLDQAARRADGDLRCLIAALAAERYRRAHGRWPDSLDALVPEFLPAVPLDPEDGQPLRYQRLADRVVIYSRTKGPGSSSGQAIYNPKKPSPPGIGVAVHLFDVKHRRQPAPELLPPPVADDVPQ